MSLKKIGDGIKLRGLPAQLSPEERERALYLRSTGCSVRETARQLGRAYSTVSKALSGKKYGEVDLNEDEYFNYDLYARQTSTI